MIVFQKTRDLHVEATVTIWLPVTLLVNFVPGKGCKTDVEHSIVIYLPSKFHTVKETVAIATGFIYKLFLI